jgi:hypothetical protein
MTTAQPSTIAIDELTEARLVVHWAGQIASAAGNSRIAARDDSSHTNLGWDHDHQALVTHDLQDDGLRAGLRAASLELLIIRGAEIIARQALEGLTLARGLEWLAAGLDTASDSKVALARPSHEMPTHPLADGAVFPAASAAHGAVAEWFHLADHLLGDVARHNHDRAPAPRCWPHHFDIATLITVTAHEDPEHAASVGVGMTPGDGTYSAPYFYVTPWPYPPAEDLPALSVGQWHTKGWVGAVLQADAVLDGAPGLAGSFVSSAVASCLAIAAKGA